MGVTIRDFLYLDIERVRSLLAQLEGGVVEATVEKLKSSKQGRAGISVFQIFELRGNLVRERGSEQTKTLQDALFMLFEEAALASGLFDPGVELDNHEAWETGRVHEVLREGQLVRSTGATRILDAKHFRERVERFARWPRLLASFTGQEQLANIKSDKERERRLQQITAETVGGPGAIQLIRDIGEFVDLFLGGQISMRHFPCGIDYPDLAFVGMLLGRAGYLQEEREALFGKYGATASPWTVVAQVATVPRVPVSKPDLNFGDLVTASDRIDRAQFEEMAMKIMEILETMGIAEGPQFPSIAVTPLAVFREVDADRSADSGAS
jgi:hypothetical protein